MPTPPKSEAFLKKARITQMMSSGPECGVHKVLAVMPNDLKEGFLEAMADQEIHATIIAELLAEEGYPVEATALRRHRRDRCKCSEREKLLNG